MVTPQYLIDLGCNEQGQHLYAEPHTDQYKRPRYWLKEPGKPLTRLQETKHCDTCTCCD